MENSWLIDSRTHSTMRTVAMPLCIGLLAMFLAPVLHAQSRNSVLGRHSPASTQPDSRSLDLGPHASGKTIFLIGGINLNGKKYYVLNIKDNSKNAYEINHRDLNDIFSTNGSTSSDDRTIFLKDHLVRLLNNSEILSLRSQLNFSPPNEWQINGRNIASSTRNDKGHHYNISLQTNASFTDGGGVYGGVAIVEVIGAANPPVYVVKPANIAGINTSSSAQVGVNRIDRAIDTLGVAGWARCVAADTTVAALIVRGDRVPRAILEEHEAIGSTLAAMRRGLLARNYTQPVLDNFIRSYNARILTSSDPILSSFQMLDRCIGDIARATQ